ncbi:hypothetical protein F5Y16DRAFT_374147 [Xylariaceae sp. FL0255]|nr:hypothetical protein F5Y16DRAFT_374147 [Xylariaceae sp. FL0255]
MSTYEARRRQNIEHNRDLIKRLDIQALSSPPNPTREQPAAKRRKLSRAPQPPTRVSARLANTVVRPVYTAEDDDSLPTPRQGPSRSKKSPINHQQSQALQSPSPPEETTTDLESLKACWTSWTPTAEPPTRDEQGTYHFASHPQFTPNKSPESIIREGSFGGSYWRPLYTKRLKTTITDDWRELPAEWTDGLSVDRYLTSETYDPEVNKFGVACGQSIEEWEAAGWIAHEFDVRGWFQWYCRFWLGRRCVDDERQISRWRKCVGETGRWRRTLLKKYVQNGIRSVTDEGDELDEKPDVSPVVHQTCHHWAYEVRQEALDRFWSEGI